MSLSGKKKKEEKSNILAFPLLTHKLAGPIYIMYLSVTSLPDKDEYTYRTLVIHLACVLL